MPKHLETILEHTKYHFFERQVRVIIMILYHPRQCLRVRLDKIYFVKIENWKYYNKIIFKYMNSTMRLIFNEKVTEKWSL